MSADWPSGWSRGLLDVAILAVLADDDAHGYAISQTLQARGFGRITGGGLYPVLGRLEEAALVEAAWDHSEAGPGRKGYRLTGTGRAALGEHARAWDRFSSAVDRLLATAEETREDS